MEFFKKILDKLKNGNSLTNEERWDLICEFEFHREYGDIRRWYTEVRSILEIEDRLYAIDWLSGNTEMQESQYDEDPFEVRKIIKTITVEEYVEV